MKAQKVTVAKSRSSLPSHKNRIHYKVYGSVRVFETLLKKAHKKLSAFLRGVSSWMKYSLKRRIIFGGVSICVIVGLLVIVITALAGSPAEASGRYAASSVKPSALQSSAPESNQTPTPIKTTAPEPSPSPTPKATDSPKPTTKPSAKPSAKPTPKPTPKPSSASLTELAKFYIVDSDKYYSDYKYSSNNYNYNEDDITVLARVITKEAGSESSEGQLAVGNVVLNRVFCGHFGSSLEAVATAPGQFAYDSSIVPKQSCLNAARDVLQNEHWVVAQNVYYFHAGGTSGSGWGNHTFYSKIGNQSFYSETIGRRYNGTSIPPKLFSRIYKWPQYGCQPGKGVSRIQHMLSVLGYDTDKDGYFGKTTKQALMKFQKSKGIRADGVGGASTIKALIKAYGKDKYCKEFNS